MYIYKITNILNGKMYIGQTISKVSTRWSQHIHAAFKNRSNSLIALAIKKYGKESFNVETIEICDHIEQLNIREQELIKQHNTLSPNGYNLDSGGKNNIMHQSTKDKISKIMTGKKRGSFSKEHCDKISQSLKAAGIKPVPTPEGRAKAIATLKAKKGWKHTELSKNKMSANQKRKFGQSNHFFGKKHSDETKAKISASRKGRFSGENSPMFGKTGHLSPKFGKECSAQTKAKISKGHDRFKIRVLFVNENIIFDSVKQAARILVVSPSGIRKVLKGKARSIKGLQFEYAENK